MANVDTTRLIAAVVGLAGFSVALISGIAADNPFDVVVSRALVALAACAVAGLALGLILHAALAKNLAQPRAASTPRAAPPTPEAPLVV
ncbi:MAG: hypothetical protein ACKVS8_00820 [Phycisphaerales bacterium]